MIEERWRFHWDAFHDLSSERQLGMSIGPIPRSAIKAYAEEFDIIGDAFDQFERIIRKVDNEYLALLSASMKSAASGKGKGTTAPASDIAGVHGVMARLGARASAAKRKH